MSELLLGVAGIITASAMLVTAFRTNRKVEAVHAKVVQIDRAVNGQPPGTQTLVSQMQQIHDKQFPPPEPNGNLAILPMLTQMQKDIASLMPKP